jgi:hypothetical protein
MGAKLKFRALKPGINYSMIEKILFLKLVVEHPVDAKLVNTHTEARAPECVLERHGDLSAIT